MGNNISEEDHSAAAIVSYIGIPLAVLGVIPIFYTSINSIVTAAKIRRKLHRNAVTNGVTRSSILSGIIECEFPRFSLTPLSRDDPDYWSLNPHPTRLKGGSWTIFNWNTLATGRKTYRVQFSADMQVPQAEVDFEELVGFLVDRGARPDAKGWKLLNMAGLWTPANTSLLLSADESESVLRVTFPEDSDGILSLALQWKVGWEKLRDDDGLPPHWMRVKDGRSLKVEEAQVAQDEKSDAVTQAESKDDSNKTLTNEKTEAGISAPELSSGSTSDSVAVAKASDASTTPAVKFPTSVAIHLSMRSSMPIIDNIQSKTTASTFQQPSAINSNSYISTGPSSPWLAAIATALGTLQGVPIFTIHMPEEYSTLAAKDSLPCGILVMCGLLQEEESPSWATRYDPNEEAQEFHARHTRQFAERNAEMGLPPAQRAAAQRLREARERQEFFQESTRRMQRDKERRDRREREALESTRLTTETAVAAVLKKLSQVERYERDQTAGNSNNVNLLQPWTSVQSAAETVLFMMLTEEHVGKEVSGILERWRLWTDRGGMNQNDFDHLLKDDMWRYLAYAIVAMALLKEEGKNKESSLALDLQDCVRTWKRVRLG